MPNNVEISYQVFVKGLEQIKELSAKTAELSQQNAKYEQTIKRMNSENEKTDSILRKTGKSIRAFRQEIFPIAIGIGLAVVALKSLTDASDNLRAPFERLGMAGKSLSSTIGDLMAPAFSELLDPIARAIQALDNFIKKSNETVSIAARLASGTAKFALGGFLGFGGGVADTKSAKEKEAKQAQSDSLRVMKQREDLLVRVAKAEGDNLKAFDLQAEQQKRLFAMENNAWDVVKNRVKAYDQLNDKQRQQLGLLDTAIGKERERLRLQELGLKTMGDIGRDFQRNVIGAFQSTMSNTIFSALQGEKIDPKEVLRGFATQINKAVSEAVSQAITTSLFQGGNFFDNLKSAFTGESLMTRRQQQQLDQGSTAETTRKIMNQKLDQISQCICNAMSAMQGGGRGGMTMSIEGGGGGGFLHSFGGLLSSIGSMGSMLGGIGSIANIASSAGSTIGGGIAGGAGSIIPNISGLTSLGDGIIPNLPMGNLALPTIGAFASGGEIPALVSPGEFVVNRAASGSNKDLLQQINSGAGKKVPGTQNVFMIKANDADSFANQLSSPSSRAQLEIQVIRSIMNNGQVRKIIKEFAR